MYKMGRAKQAMLEYEEHEWGETHANFTCPECGKLSEGEIEVPKIIDHHDYEFSIDIDVVCIWCHEQFNAEFSMDANGCKISFDGYPETLVKFDPVYLEDYADDNFYDDEDFFYDQPVQPFLVFMDACSELIEMVNLHAIDDGEASMNRMFFSQSFSIFETYLCDTFLNLVFLDENNRKIFIDQHKSMKEVSFTASEMMKNSTLTASEILKKKIIQVVKQTLFHNLGKSMALFKMYKINLFSETEEKELLLKAVEYRHHAVHRNGCDLEGSKLDVYSKKYILQVSKAMMVSAKIINQAIAKIEIEEIS